MMIHHKGLNYLKSALYPPTNDADTGDDVTLQMAAVHSLLFLAEELGFHWSKPTVNQRGESGSSDAVLGTLDHDVTFVMDDGSHVTGSRSLLSATSTVFTAMLEGSYKESDQTEIPIKHADTKAFQLLIKHLHGCDIQIALETAHIENTFEVLLETLALSDRYMLESLEAEITKYICTKYMCKETLPHIFEVACIHTCNDLIRSCIQFTMARELDYKESSETLKEMFSGSHAAAAFDELRKLISEKLKSA